jgi:multiple antibiotic resistance protein
MTVANPILQALIHDALVLFAMVNVVGNFPVFADLTAGLPRKERRRAFDIAVLTGASIVITFAFLGSWMLQSLFQVDTNSFKVAGGLLVFFVAARGMIMGNQKAHVPHPESLELIGVFPMGYPFLAGPGTIVTTILLMQEGGAWITACAAGLVYLTVLPLLYLTPVIHLVIGRVGVMVISRILYIFICAKAVAYVLAGLKASFL